MLDSRYRLVDRMENTKKLLREFSRVEQRWMTEDIWEGWMRGRWWSV